MKELTINNWKIISNPGDLIGEWITAGELGRHLGYADPRDAVNKIYERNKNFFKDDVDVATVNLGVATGRQDARIFSERGVLKILRYSKTDLADQVMEEVFDVFLQAKKGTTNNLDARMARFENHPMVQQKRQMDELMVSFLEIEERQIQIEREQKKQSEAIEEVRAKTEAVLSQSNYYSILGFANLIGVKLDLKIASNLGKLATKLSNESGIAISSVSDPRFGKVNVYHRDVLDSIFNNLYKN